MSTKQVNPELVTFENDYIESQWWSKLWMSWATPFMEHVNKNKAMESAKQ